MSQFVPTAQTTITHDSLVMGEGVLEGRSVYLLAQDARHEGGSFGAIESDAVAAWLVNVREQPKPLVLFLDSGGARVNEGLAALGGFRRLFGALADVRLASVPTLAVCGRTVFGGASMLACVANERVFFERSLFGMSGPRIVQAIAGVDDFDAANKKLLVETMGGAARAARKQGVPVADHADALRAQCVKTLDRICAVGTNDAKNALDDSLISQRQQLERDGLTRAPKREIVPTAQLGGLKLRAAWADDGVLIGRTHDDGYVYGFVSGVWADSWHAWRLSNALMCQLETAPSAPVHLVLDCPAHATNRSLEEGMISQYFSLLGLVLRAFRTYGAKVTLHIIGDAAGGVHVALASGAQHVIAYEKSADIRILPRVAVEQVREDAARAEAIPSARVWITTGVADEIVAS